MTGQAPPTIVVRGETFAVLVGPNAWGTPTVFLYPEHGCAGGPLGEVVDDGVTFMVDAVGALSWSGAVRVEAARLALNAVAGRVS